MNRKKNCNEHHRNLLLQNVVAPHTRYTEKLNYCKLVLVIHFNIYTTINTTDEFRNVWVMEVGVAGWAWSLHGKQSWIGNCK